jgi:WD40 repeat protein/serine/threonine protein kinase
MAKWNPEANDLFLRAAEIEAPADRQLFLDRQCAGDAGLRQQVEALLAASEKAGSFLIRPAIQAPVARGATVDYAPPAEGPGTIIGAYKLLQQIGEGGFGVVYMAEQEHPVRRKVALKIIKPGMDTKEVIARFEAERQALAMMDHQNIAKVLDAATTDAGRPFFVMELVHGIPITQFCDENRLTPRERLELFIPVCQAIQHAHHKGIIHRDVKPSNVLVTLYDDKPVPKVIDFGVAKATEQRLTERTLFTQFGAMVGTFEYMSPEQAAMNALGVDTRSDIYSLGVLLYELLTGSTPLERKRLRGAAYDELLRLIKEEEPPRPSTRLSTSEKLPALAAARRTEPAKLSRLLRGEIDWIVMKCLEKDRSRRYETANSLARDLQRYLSDEPVEACPPSAGYRLRKMLRRHKGPMIAASVILLALIVGIVGTTWGLIVAEQARRDAVAAEQAAAGQRRLAERERETAEERRRLAERRLAENYLDQALAVCALGGDAGHGLLQLVRALESTPKHAPDLERAVRLNLAAWSREVHALRATYPIETRDFESAALSPDGKTLLMISYPGRDRAPRLWDVVAKRSVGSPLEHGLFVWGAAFSPDGKTVATVGGKGSDSRKVQGQEVGAAWVWDVATGKPCGQPLPHPSTVHRVAFSHDGKALLTHCQGDPKKGIPGEVRLWDLATGKLRAPVLRNEKEGFRAAALSPDGKTVLTGSEKTSQLWDAATGKPLGPPLPVTISSQSFSPDGKTILTWSKEGIQLWNLETGRAFGPPIRYQGVGPVALSPDGKNILTPSKKGTQLWKTSTGKPAGPPLRASDGYLAKRFLPDGRTILTADHFNRAVRVWEMAVDQSSRLVLPHPGISIPSRSLNFSPDRKAVLISAERSVRAYEVATGKALGPLLRLEDGDSYAYAFYSLDGKTFLTLGWRTIEGKGRPELRLWDAANYQPLGPPTPAPSLHPYRYPCFHLNSTKIVTAEKDGTVRVWEVVEGRIVNPRQIPEAGYGDLALHPDGKIVLASSRKGGYRFWDLTTGNPVGPPLLHRGRVQSVAFSRNGKLAATGGGPAAQVWDVATGQPVGTRLHHELSVSVVSFSPNGQFLVTAGGDGVRLWDIATSKPIGPAMRHDGADLDVGIGPDSRSLVTGQIGKAPVICRWPVSVPVTGTVEHVKLWVQVLTGTELDEHGSVQKLSASTWDERRRRLNELGGSPAHEAAIKAEALRGRG